MKRLSLILVMVGVIAVGFGIAYADDALPINSNTQNSIVTLNVPHAAQLDIDIGAASGTLIADGTAETAFEAGYVDILIGNPTLTVRANKNCTLSAKSSGFGALSVGGYTKDVGDLMLKNTGSNKDADFADFESLSTDNQIIANYASGVGVLAAGNPNPIKYRINLDWTRDIPGTYIATVTYTLATLG